MPELCSWLQVLVDESGKNGEFILPAETPKLYFTDVGLIVKRDRILVPTALVRLKIRLLWNS